MMSWTVIRGDSDAYGSWNTICKSRRRARSSAPRARVTSLPATVIRPEVGVSSRTTIRPVVVLPQPDSPTRPSVRPAGSEKSTPSTAWTLPERSRSGPDRTGKCLVRPVTPRTSSGSGRAAFSRSGIGRLLPRELVVEMAGAPASRTGLRRLRALLPAPGPRHRAPRRERAAARDLAGRRRRPGDRGQVADVAVEVGQAVQQPPRVRVPGRLE